MPLKLSINTFRAAFQPRSVLTDVSPSISCFVHFHPRGDNIGGVAEEREPHVFDVEIVKRLPYCAVELVPLVNKISVVSQVGFWLAHSSVCDDRVGHVRKQTPYVTHPPAKLFGSRRTGDKITLSCVESTDECSDTGAWSSQPREVERITLNECIPPI